MFTAADRCLYYPALHSRKFSSFLISRNRYSFVMNDCVLSGYSSAEFLCINTLPKTRRATKNLYIRLRLLFCPNLAVIRSSVSFTKHRFRNACEIQP